MKKIAIKPLSVNQVWQGKRYKTNLYKKYERDMLLLLPCLKEIPRRIKLTIEVGFSNKCSDLDNVCKPFADILCKKYGFDDRDIYRIVMNKTIVKKGFEYISFKIEGLI